MRQLTSVLLLPGQGSQKERMAAGLYGAEPVFTWHMDAFFRAMGRDADRVRELWLSRRSGVALDDASIAQPLLFSVGHALGRTVMSWGITPVLLGHSVGELAAAFLAGVFAPETAPLVMAARQVALEGAGRGGMLAVAAPVGELTAYLGRGVAVGAVNGPRQTVLSGPDGPLSAVASRLREAGITARPLRSGHAFHSPVMSGCAERFATLLAALPPLSRPRCELVSSRTARSVRPDEAVSPEFWAGQLALPVLFWPALRALLEARAGNGTLLLFDGSPDGSLSAPVRRHPTARSGTSVVIPLLPTVDSGSSGDIAALTAAREQLARIREAG
jgi:acyl transferase domain-containing protein